MTQFSANVNRIDPYANFKFIIKWDKKPVAAVSKVSGLTRSTEVISFRAGGDPSKEYKQPGQTKYEAITIERGVTQDTEFAQWANKVWYRQNSVGKEVSADFRKDVTIELLDEAGQVALTYQVFKCWVSEYKALPDLDAKSNDVAIQSIKLENEGWIQIDIKPPKDSSFTEPTTNPTANK